MRDCIFLVADKNMEASFTGFLTRPQFHLSLGSGAFLFDPREDLIVDEAGSDPGVYTRAHELMRLYLKSHRHAVIALDEAWDGSPGATRIRDTIQKNMLSVGWSAEAFEVVVIQPELENWIWQDSPHLEKAFRFNHLLPLRQWLVEQKLWPEGVPKPPDPKKAAEETARAARTPRSSAIYQKICSQVSVRHCKDDSFKQLQQALARWFPKDA